MNMCFEVSMMDSCVDLLRDGILEMVHRIFAHLKKCHNDEMLFDQSLPNIINNNIEKRD